MHLLPYQISAISLYHRSASGHLVSEPFLLRLLSHHSWAHSWLLAHHSSSHQEFGHAKETDLVCVGLSSSPLTKPSFGSSTIRVGWPREVEIDWTILNLLACKILCMQIYEWYCGAVIHNAGIIDFMICVRCSNACALTNLKKCSLVYDGLHQGWRVKKVNYVAKVALMWATNIST